MPLREYHEKYAAKTLPEIATLAGVRDDGLKVVFEKYPPDKKLGWARVAILGCGDKRLIDLHRVMFEKHLQRAIALQTFDIAVTHLEGEVGVVQHDCTRPLPEPPYDVTFSHSLLKFVEQDHQWDVVRNSFEALVPGGLAIHFIDTGEWGIQGHPLPEGGKAVPIEHLEAELDHTDGVESGRVELPSGLALVIRKK